LFHFGEFTLDASRYLLQRGDRTLRLEKRPMEFLILLLEKRGELVCREEVARRLWGADVFVDVDHGINTAVRKIRIALRDNPEKPRFIETVVGKGYRFAAPVVCSGNGKPLEETPPEPTTGVQPILVHVPAGPAVEHAAVAPQDAIPKRTWLLGRGAILVIGVVAALLFGIRWKLRQTSHPAIRSLAVLPLKNLSGDPTQQYLADGLTEELIGRLAAIHNLRVISRTSVMHFRDTTLTAPEIAKALHVDALVEGSIIRDGSRVRVHAQLIRASTDEHFWSETYDRELRDVLSLQSDVAQAIARKVKVTVAGDERQRLSAFHAVLPEAYESYLQGNFSLHNSNNKAAIEKSIRYYSDAISKDPAFAPAYVGLAAAHAALGTVMMGGDPGRERPQMVSAARTALKLDPGLAEAHILLADIAQKQWHWAEAESEYRRALELDPNDPDAYTGLAEWFLCQGRADDALNWEQHARELDSFGSTNWELAWILFHSRRYDEAIRELRNTLAVRPDDASSLWLLGFTLVVKGQPQEAIPVLEKAAKLANRSSGYIDVLAAAYARAGRRTDALRILAELKKRKQAGYVAAGSFVILALGLGDKEQAFAWLDEAYKEKSNILQFVKVHPLMDPLRSDPRFGDLVRRVGLN
jgi:TolB-like protein/DNA-binding winged helix-turn-helix (wHTH) protein/Flp pilus assembly protein TadD